VAHALTSYESLREALGFVRSTIPTDQAYVPVEAVQYADRNVQRWATAWAALNDLGPLPEAEVVQHARTFLSEHLEEYLAWERRFGNDFDEITGTRPDEPEIAGT
jgi:hypothetical protein